MGKEYIVPSKKQPVFKVVRGVIKGLFFGKIDFLSLSGDIPEKCIFVCNHEAKMGPMAYEIALPVFNVKWGAHQMLGNYKSRWLYLRDVFYMQKKGWKKFPASFVATFEALFSKMIYKGMKLIGSYPDVRLRTTIKNSVKVLDDNKAITIFPEDSNNGYHTIMTDFFPGFVMLSEQYYRLRNEDLPIYPVYYSHKMKKMVVGVPVYLQPLINKGMDRTQICEYFKELVNNLYYTFFESKANEKA